MKITPQNIAGFNQNLRHENPLEIIEFILGLSQRPLVTTSFGKYSAALLHACAVLDPSIQVVWCDTGYNTKATYGHADKLVKRLALNLDIFTPRFTRAYIDSVLGEPEPSHPDHAQFTEWVKLEPFRRALSYHKPDSWFTNLRKAQNTHRSSLDILTFSKEGILKVAPFFYHSEEQILDYLDKNKLPTESNYHDPVKAETHRECGIHFS